MTDREVFEKNLRYFLQKSGKSQRELAEYVGAKYSTVSGWTRGVSYPRADSMEKIADFFGIPTTQLVDERSSSCSSDELILTNIEQQIIIAYRTVSSDTQAAVRNVLGLNAKN